MGKGTPTWVFVLGATVFAAAVATLAYGEHYYRWFRGEDMPRIDCESAARHELALLAGCQGEIQRTQQIDEDADGVGEFVSLEVLARHGWRDKVKERRSTESWISPNCRPYVFALRVPGEVDLRERCWYAVAWPVGPPPARAHRREYRKSFAIVARSPSSGEFYWTEKLTSEPSAADLFSGEPFTSPVRADVWTRLDR